MNTEQYPIDRRMTCRFGVRCYQKNPEHHKKYKHPPKRADHGSRDDPKAKRQKNDDPPMKADIKQISPERKQNACIISNDISDSDSEDTSPANTQSSKILTEEEVATTSTLNDKINLVQPFIKSNTQKPYRDLKPKAFIKEKFLVDMPKDFYEFWDLCKSIDAKNPSTAFQDADLLLVGPYDVLNGKFADCNKMFSEEEFLLHWRYYYDPPEFQTVLEGNDKTGYHIGYFRDDPEGNPVFLACNSSEKDGIISSMGENIFAAVSIYLEEKEKFCNPFQKLKISKLLKIVNQEAVNLKYSLLKKTEDIKTRDRKIVTRSFNKIGLVVPYNRKTQLGYRELHMDNKELSTILEKIKTVSNPLYQEKMFDQLQPLFTYTSIALDECDFGTGIELGWNILFYGIDGLNKTTARFLSNSYSLLNRDAFATIAKAHMNNRRKGIKLSIL